MKKILIVFSIAALFISVQYARSSAKEISFSLGNVKDEKGYLIKKESLPKDIQIITGVSTSADFKITGDDNSAPYVEIFAKENNKKLSQQEVQKILDEKYIIEIQVSNRELKLTAKRKTSIGFGWSNSDNINISFNVHVPVAVASTITTNSGDVQLYHLKGNQTFKATSGDIVAEHIDGNLQINTTSGDAQLSYISGSSFSFEAASGDLIMRNCLCGTIKSATASGDVSLDDVSGNLNVVSASGDIHIEADQGSITTSSASGDQKIEIRKPTQFIRSSAQSGDVRLSIPRTIGADINISGSSVYMSNREKFSGNIYKEKTAVGKWNGGGLPIQVSTGSGDISLEWN